MSKPTFNPNKPFESSKPSFDPNQPFTTSESKSPDMLSTLYHGAIEGGAMGVGGAAGAVLGSPAGPVGSAAGAVGLAAAMYPPAKRAAEAIDRMRGIQTPEQPSIAKEYGQGLAIEATGLAMKPVLNTVGKMLPGSRAGEMISGSPAQNFKRAYKQGFTETYLKPKPLSEAGENFGAAKTALMEKLTPEDQVGMMVNPSGEANKKVADVMTRFLKGEPISAEDALMARQAVDTIFPADVARRQTQRGGLSQFRDEMNRIIADKNPAFKAASDDYAASKLRSQLLKPLRVNKSNPDQYSKLGGMLNAGAVGVGASLGAALPAVGAALVSSPLAMGLTASIAGSASRTASKIMTPSLQRAVMTAFIDKVTTKED